MKRIGAFAPRQAATLGAAALFAGAVCCAVRSPAAAAGGDATVLARAQAASGRASFAGTVLVRWVDGRRVVHQVTLPATGEGGSLRLGTSAGTGATPAPGPLVVAWAGRTGVDPKSHAPDPTARYDVSVSAGPLVVGRPTQRVTLATAGVTVEELDADIETGLFLRRRTFDPSGRTVRTVEFVTLDRLDVAVSSAAARLPMSWRSTPRWAGLPAQLGEGMHRLGVHRHDNIVQGIYGDGLRTVSVFVEPGAVDARSLPDDGEAVAIGQWAALRWTWAGGQVVTWSDGRCTMTVVSDGTSSDALEAADVVAAARLPVSDPMARLRARSREVVSLLG